MKLEILRIIGACSYAPDRVKPELIHVNALISTPTIGALDTPRYGRKVRKRLARP